jgi:4'-phosphopantetheinyl transferase EntD
VISDITKITIADAWKSILPEDVFVSEGSLEDEFPPVTVSEQISLGTVNGKRMREFSIGRMHAHQALAQMGICDVDIPRNNLTGAPVWPSHVVGSITHADGSNISHVAAVVASSEKFKILGIDAEFCDQIHPTIWSQFLSARELDLISSVTLFERSDLACKAWTLKEAAIKAVGKGDMSTWEILKKSPYGVFEVINSTLGENIKLKGRVVSLENLTLAIVYCSTNS